MIVEPVAYCSSWNTGACEGSLVPAKFGYGSVAADGGGS